MANNPEPLALDGKPLFFHGRHNAWFEEHHALPSGSVANAYRQHFGTSAPFVLSDLLPTTLKRSNARKMKHPNAGKFGIAGVSGLRRTDGPKKMRVGQGKQYREVDDLMRVATMGSYVDSVGSRRSSGVAKSSPGKSPTFDQFEDPPM